MSSVIKSEIYVIIERVRKLWFLKYTFAAVLRNLTILQGPWAVATKFLWLCYLFIKYNLRRQFCEQPVGYNEISGEHMYEYNEKNYLWNVFWQLMIIIFDFGLLLKMMPGSYIQARNK